MVGTDLIRIKGLEFYAYHGVLPEESRLGQKFVIDLELSLDLGTAGRTDRVEDTVSYAEVAFNVQKIVQGERCALLECLAQRIADAVLKQFPCQAVRVTVHKPGAPVSLVFKDISVEIFRTRNSY